MIYAYGIIAFLLILLVRSLLVEFRLRGRYQDKILEIESYRREISRIQQKVEKAHSEFMGGKPVTSFSRSSQIKANGGVE